LVRRRVSRLRAQLQPGRWARCPTSRRGQDHLLASTSVVQQVDYGRRAVTYHTFHADGTETLRLTFRPTAVTADGQPLALRARLDQAGYTVAPLQGGDLVVRVRRDAARDVAITG
jgi:hypothetical protein